MPTAPGNTYNDGGLRFGTQSVSIDTGGTTTGGTYTPEMQDYILEAFSLTRGTNWAESADENGVPNKQHGRITIPTGDATLQLENETTKSPAVFAEFIAEDISGNSVTLIVSQVGETTGNEAAAKVTISLRKKINTTVSAKKPAAKKEV